MEESRELKHFPLIKELYLRRSKNNEK